MAEFAKLAEDHMAELKELGKTLNETFNGERGIALKIQSDPITTLLDVPEQSRWNFSWRTVENRSYAGGYISWIRRKQWLGLEQHDKSTRATTTADKAQLKTLKKQRKADSKINNAPQKDSEIEAQIKKELTDSIAKYYTDKFTKLQQAHGGSAPFVPGNTDFAGSRNAFESGVRQYLVKVGCTTVPNNKIALAYTHVNMIKDDIAVPLAKHIVDKKSDKVVRDKYSKLQQRYFQAIAENNYRASHGIKDGQELAPDVRARIRGKTQVALAKLDTDWNVSVVIGFGVQYSVVEIDKEDIEFRWQRLLSDLEVWKQTEQKQTDLKLVKYSRVGGKIDKDDDIYDLYQTTLKNLKNAAAQVDKIYEAKLKELNDSKKYVDTLIAKIGRRIGTFRLVPVAEISGLPVRVHSRDSEAQLTVAASAETDGGVSVHVDYAEHCVGAAKFTPGATGLDAGDLHFSPTSVKGTGDFGKQWLRLSNVA